MELDTGLFISIISNKSIINFGEKAPATAIRQNNLALVLQDLGDKQNLLTAKVLFSNAFWIMQSKFSQNHPYYQQTMENLTSFYLWVKTGKKREELAQAEMEALAPNFWEWVAEESL